MTMTELREAFAAWPQMEYYRYPRQVAAEKIMHLLTDPTPITEAGLRKLGFHLADIPGKHRIFSLGETAVHIDADGGCEIDASDFSGYVKTIGQLRGLLLFVGE